MNNINNKIVVSDTTAITYFANIKSMHLFKSLYNVIYIPQAVYSELTIHGDDMPGCKEVKNLSWIKIEKVKDTKYVSDRISCQLDIGELEAIALSLQKNADMLIIDEKKGRKQAANLGIKTVGMLGIFISAKEKGVIEKVKPYLDKLKLTNFKMGPALYDKVLKICNE